MLMFLKTSRRADEDSNAPLQAFLMKILSGRAKVQIGVNVLYRRIRKGWPICRA